MSQDYLKIVSIRNLVDEGVRGRPGLQSTLVIHIRVVHLHEETLGLIHEDSNGSLQEA